MVSTTSVLYAPLAILLLRIAAIDLVVFGHLDFRAIFVQVVVNAGSKVWFMSMAMEYFVATSRGVGPWILRELTLPLEEFLGVLVFGSCHIGVCLYWAFVSCGGERLGVVVGYPGYGGRFRGSIGFYSLYNAGIRRVGGRPTTSRFGTARFVFYAGYNTGCEGNALFYSRYKDGLTTNSITGRPFRQMATGGSIGATINIGGGRTTPGRGGGGGSIFSVVTINATYITLILITTVVVNSMLVFKGDTPGCALCVGSRRLFCAKLSGVGPMRVARRLLSNSCSSLDNFNVKVTDCAFLSSSNGALFCTSRLSDINSISGCANIAVCYHSMDGVGGRPVGVSSRVLDVRPSGSKGGVMCEACSRGLCLRGLGRGRGVSKGIIVCGISRSYGGVMCVACSCKRCSVCCGTRNGRGMGLSDGVSDFMARSFSAMFCVGNSGLCGGAINGSEIGLSSGMSSVGTICRANRICCVGSSDGGIGTVSCVRSSVGSGSRTFMVPRCPSTPSSKSCNAGRRCRRTCGRCRRLYSRCCSTRGRCGTVRGHGRLHRKLGSCRVDLSMGSLCCYDKGGDILVSSSLATTSKGCAATTTSGTVITFCSCSGDSVGGIGVSRVNCFSRVRGGVSRTVTSSITTGIIVGSGIAGLSHESTVNISFSSGYGTMCFFSGISRRRCATSLCGTSVSNDGIGGSGHVSATISGSGFTLFGNSIMCAGGGSNSRRSALCVSNGGVSSSIHNFGAARCNYLVCVASCSSSGRYKALGFCGGNGSGGVTSSISDCGITMASGNSVLCLCNHRSEVNRLCLFGNEGSGGVSRSIALLMRDRDC